MFDLGFFCFISSRYVCLYGIYKNGPFSNLYLYKRIPNFNPGSFQWQLILYAANDLVSYKLLPSPDIGNGHKFRDILSGGKRERERNLAMGICHLPFAMHSPKQDK